MYDTTVILLADLSEFPHAQHYAACFSILFSDIGRRDRLQLYKPDRHDYTKVYIASKNNELIEKFKATHDTFGVEVYNDVPDYTKKSVREVASILLSKSFIDPFDDLKYERERIAKQAVLDKAVKAAEKDGKFMDPRPDVALDPSIKLKRKGSFRNA
jgi:hypothetical protein